MKIEYNQKQVFLHKTGACDVDKNGYGKKLQRGDFKLFLIIFKKL